VALSCFDRKLRFLRSLDLAERVAKDHQVERGARMAWLFGGAIAMGTGIWSVMHLREMMGIAYLAGYYHIPDGKLSLVAAICASFWSRWLW